MGLQKTHKRIISIEYMDKTVCCPTKSGDNDDLLKMKPLPNEILVKQAFKKLVTFNRLVGATTPTGLN
ncbi:hypothetical protein QQP08_004180 [Theobroma cacao]|nr:hypothetical protein QQP08_004180 [Theobroma cacao]